MKRLIIILFLLPAATIVFGQQPRFSHQDTLRGSITPERSWWDLTWYHLNIKVNPADSTTTGSNIITYKVLTNNNLMQIDLQSPLAITGAYQDDQKLDVKDVGNAHYIKLVSPQVTGTIRSVVINYGGRPKIATRPPWEGGITWSTDKNGMPWIASSCQGAGASLWWPCKDHMYDEPDSMLISVTVPKNLTDVSNGRLRSITENKKEKTRTFNWVVVNPINNYGVNINVGDYVNFSEKFKGENGMLDCSYWVLKQDLEKAKIHFRQVTKMLEAFEYWFGPYPFYEDSYKLVEAPYLGMEHQSSVTYGNGFQNGYSGHDLSGTGWGDKWDFIIVHESGHEWFANNITYRDIADMWIHESFTNYSESLYIEYFYGKEAGKEYVRGTRKNILNDKPVTGFYNVNNEGSGDMYYKGGNMLNTLRRILDDDVKWREILRGLNKEFYHQVVDAKQVENYISKMTGLDLKTFFDQYLLDTRIPVFEYYVKGNELNFRWSNCIRGFNMPLILKAGGKEMRINPRNWWTKVIIDTPDAPVEVNPDFYVAVMNIMGK